MSPYQIHDIFTFTLEIILMSFVTWFSNQMGSKLERKQQEVTRIRGDDCCQIQKLATGKEETGGEDIIHITKLIAIW